MITVFTPVYNRKYIIRKLYESLLRQTSYHFEWLVIDDGSTDNLQELVNFWKAQAPFPILYYYVKNGGKHRAINKGAKMANGEIFFIVDSDDYLADDAIEFVEKEFAKIICESDFAGMSGLMCSILDGKIIGGEPSFHGFVDATNFERARYGLLKDKPCIYKTKIWLDNPLPEFKGENFLSEGVSHNTIAGQRLKIRWFNKRLLYVEYREDGLSRNLFERRQENPLGWAANIVSNVKYICQDIESVFKERYLFYECMHQKYTKEKMCRMLEISEEEYFYLREKWNRILNSLDTLLKKHQISSLALYGMGMNAKRLLLYLQELGLGIQYGIDKNYSLVQFKPAYSLDMELPTVDSICITIKDWTLNLKEEIKRKSLGAYVWVLVELDDIFK